MSAAQFRAGVDRLQVLVSDCQQPWERPVVEALNAFGAQTHRAASGPEAIALTEDRRIHVAVLDVNLPALDALQTVRIINQRRMPVRTILFSQQADRQLLEEALRLNVYSVCSEPTDLPVFFETFDRLVQRFYQEFLKR